MRLDHVSYYLTLALGMLCELLYLLVVGLVDAVGALHELGGFLRHSYFTVRTSSGEVVS